MKETLIIEFNKLAIPDMPEVTELFEEKAQIIAEFKTAGL